MIEISARDARFLGILSWDKGVIPPSITAPSINCIGRSANGSRIAWRAFSRRCSSVMCTISAVTFASMLASLGCM